MKRRKGFVSNSSSSSFILSIPRKPKDKEDLFNFMFFDGDTEYVDPYEDKSYPMEDVVSAVMSQLVDQKPMTKDEMVYLVNCGHIDHPFLDNLELFKDADGNYQWEEREKLQKEIAEDVVKDFSRVHKNKEFYNVSFSDNEGDLNGAIEHGSAFDRIPHLRCSFH
jgi:hypothetical protein